MDMIDGSIFQSVFWPSIPLLIGSFLQQLHNTVDPYAIGNFVNTDALAAVGASTPVTSMLVGFFMGLPAGTGMVISQYSGARQGRAMSRAIHSTMALTGPLNIVFTGLGLSYTGPLLGAVGAPEDVLPHSSLYLMIYFCGTTLSFLYSTGSGILRAVGDSRHPPLYLAMASVVSIILNFAFVYGSHMGTTSVAITTVMIRTVSSLMVMHKLMHTCEDYKVEVRKIWFHKKMIRKIIAFGFPAVCQQSATSFSDVVAQSYINRFGTTAMTGYSATLRIDGFLQLPLQSFNITITTFAGQNVGARKYKRMKKGVLAVWVMSSLIILVGPMGMYLGASLLISMFTNDSQVIGNGNSMLRIFSKAYIVVPVIQVLNGVLRGAGFSKVLMSFMPGSFVVLRQIYLLVAVPMIHNLMVVMVGWPTTWVICVAGMFLYYVKADWLPKEAGPEGE